jgi:hypothetical protein
LEGLLLLHQAILDFTRSYVRDIFHITQQEGTLEGETMVSTPAQKGIRDSSKKWALTKMISSILLKKLWREMAVDRSHHQVLGCDFTGLSAMPLRYATQRLLVMIMTIFRNPTTRPSSQGLQEKGDEFLARLLDLIHQ